MVGAAALVLAGVFRDDLIDDFEVTLTESLFEETANNRNAAPGSLFSGRLESSPVALHWCLHVSLLHDQP
jgi:hypothetical protein